MSAPRQILAAIFDMDGLIMDSEPLWDRAELDVMASLGVDITRRDELPDTLGLRIDMVVGLWFARRGPVRTAKRSPNASSVAPSPWWKKRARCCQARVKRLLCAKPAV